MAGKKVDHTNTKCCICGSSEIDEKPYNDTYHNLMEFLKDKKWLEEN